MIRTSGDLAQSPVIHGLTEEALTEGMHIRDVLAELVPFAETHLWLCHNAALDLGILKRVFNDTGIVCPDIVVLDTLKVAVYQLKKHYDVLPSNSANLSVCRQRMGLPAAPAHNALDDAMATMQSGAESRKKYRYWRLNAHSGSFLQKNGKKLNLLIDKCIEYP